MFFEIKMIIHIQFFLFVLKCKYLSLLLCPLSPWKLAVNIIKCSLWLFHFLIFTFSTFISPFSLKVGCQVSTLSSFPFHFHFSQFLLSLFLIFMSSFSLKVGCRHYQVFTLTFSLSLFLLLYPLSPWKLAVKCQRYQVFPFTFTCSQFSLSLFYFYVLFLLESWLLTLSSFPETFNQNQI